MIPVPQLRRKAVAVFGLGGERTATARALVAGGAEVRLGRQARQRREGGAATAFRTVDLHAADWQRFRRLVLVARRAADPSRSRTGRSSAPRRPASRSSATSSSSAASGARQAPDAPFIAITGTNGKSTTTALIAHLLTAAGRDVQLGGNIGRAVLSLDPPAERHYVIECSSYQIDLAPSIDPTVGILLNLTPDHLDRHGTMEHYAAIKERLVAGATRRHRGRRQLVPADRRPPRARRQAVVRISARLPLTDGYFADGTDLIVAEDGALQSASASSTASARCAASTMRRTRGRRRRLPRSGSSSARSSRARKLSRACRTAWRRSAARPRALRQRLQGDQCRRRGTRRCRASRASTGSPAAAQGRRHRALRDYFPRIAKAYLIGEAAPAFAATLGEAVPYEMSGTLAAAVEPRPRRRARHIGRAGRAALAGLRLLRPVPEFRDAASLPALVAASTG